MPPPVIPDVWLQQVPGAGSATLTKTVSVVGGTAHRLWRVSTSSGEYVLRAPDPAQPRMAGPEFAREVALQTAAATCGLAPTLFHVNVAEQLLVMEFIDGVRWTAADFGCADRVLRLLAGVSRLHLLPPPALAPLDPVAMASLYAQPLIASDGANSAVLHWRLSAAAQAWQQCNAARRRPTIIHCDLHAGNIMERRALDAVAMQGGSQSLGASVAPNLVLLDWEYAQVGDALLDYAALCAQHPALQPQVSDYLAAAHTAPLHASWCADLPAAIAVFRLLSWTWWQRRALLQPLKSEEAQQAVIFEHRLDEDLGHYAC